MKKQILFLIGLIAANLLLAQGAQGISHQAVIRDANNELVASSTIGIQVSILQGSAEGEAVYVETHSPISNANGLITYVIGEGAVESGVFAEIDWSSGPYFLKTKADPMGGTDYTITGTTQFHSVPYAHYSQKAGTLKDGENIGEWLFWNGEQWVAVEPGQYGQTLSWCNGIPTWGPCPPAVPVVNTGAVTGITENTATGSGTVVNQGSAFVSTRGLVWSTDPNPTLQDNDGAGSSGNGTGSFSLQMTGLSSETTYYVRAYATNAEGTAYGNQVTFTTDAPTTFPPTVSTNPVTEITQTTATSGGNITDDGGAGVTARGVVWHTSSNPTLENHLGQTNDGSGTGSYVSEIIELQPNTGYYVRAYAVNSQGVSYGNQRIFVSQQDGDLPTVITAEATDITQTSATAGGEVTDDGASPVLARGVVWSTQENPTLFDNYNEEGAGLGVFTSELSGLVIGTTYYVRTFATNSQGVAYGNQVSFTTDAGLAEVIIASLNSGQPGLRVIDGEVSGDGGAEVTARGFVWNTVEDPTLEQNEGFSADGAGLGEFTIYFDDLSQNTKYYIRAYATNSEGTGYSEQKFFHFWDYHGTVTDFDENVYQTVMIGDQEWMAENLRTSNYSNGIPIPTGLSNTEWQNTTSGAYAIYDNSESMLEAYGKLYNWYAVDDSRGLCPAGWSVPSDDDWTQLIDYLDAQGYPNSSVIGGAANALRSCRQIGSPLGGECTTHTHPRWNSNSAHHGFDGFGFSAFPGGHRHFNGNFWDVGVSGQWWSATESSGADAWRRGIGSVLPVSFVSHSSYSKRYGISVRCVRDTTEEPTLFNLQLEVHPENAGSVSGAGEYEAGEMIDVDAVANEGWEFVNWTDLDGNLVSEAAFNEIEMPAENMTLIANFEEETIPVYILTLSANPEAGGEVFGAGEYQEGEEVNVTAIANEGWVFISWTGDTEHLDNANSAEAIVNMPADNVSLTATFEMIGYQLILSATPEEGGTVEGDGIYNIGDDVTITAIPNQGWEFVEWTDDTQHLDDADSAEAIVTMPAGNVWLTATFEMIDYTLTLDASPEEGGTVEGDGIYNMGDEVPVSAIANEGWAFISWTGDTEHLDDADSAEAVVTMPADNLVLTAVFQEEDDSDIIYGDGVTDIDDNYYVTVIIGNQEWMAENLRVTRYNNEDEIPAGLSNAEWESTTNGAYAIYPHGGGDTEGDIEGINSDEEMVTAYGKLYNWHAVNTGNLCPEGWSVPSDEDWTALVNYVVSQGFPNSNVTDGAGNALKSCRQVGHPDGGDCDTSEHPRWNSHSTRFGLDEFGFSALPGGDRWSDGRFGNFGNSGLWWSATESSGSNAWLRSMVRHAGGVFRYTGNKTSGYSVRCFRDLVRTEDE